MRGLRIMRAGLLASVAMGTLAIAGCALSPPAPDYVVCDDVSNAATDCGNNVVPVTVDNSH